MARAPLIWPHRLQRTPVHQREPLEHARCPPACPYTAFTRWRSEGNGVHAQNAPQPLHLLSQPHPPPVRCEMRLLLVLGRAGHVRNG